MSLSPDARTLLEATKDAHEPRDEDQARVLAALTVQVGAIGLGAAAPGDPALVRAAGRGFQSKLAVKIITGVALLAVGGGSFLWQGSNANFEVAASKQSSAPEPSAALELSGTPKQSAAPEPSAPFDSSGPSEPSAAMELSTAPRQNSSSMPSPPSAGPSRSLRAASVEDTDSLAAELTLLEGAKRALLGHSAARALTLAREHARRFPKGALIEESTAVRIEALCELGRGKESDVLHAQFVQRWPNSTLSPKRCSPE